MSAHTLLIYLSHCLLPRPDWLTLQAWPKNCIPSKPSVGPPEQNISLAGLKVLCLSFKLVYFSLVDVRLGHLACRITLEARSSKLAEGMSTWHNPIGKMYKSRFKLQSMSGTPYHPDLLGYIIRTDNKTRGAYDQVSARLRR